MSWKFTKITMKSSHMSITASLTLLSAMVILVTPNPIQADPSLTSLGGATTLLSMHAL